MKQAIEVETIEVPHRFMELARRRTRAIVRASFHDANILESIALSCYLQGLEDGACMKDFKRAPFDELREHVEMGNSAFYKPGLGL